MTIQTSTLRPGLLVALKTSVTGNVRYFKETIEPEHLTEQGTEKAKWETVREVTDRKEYDAARQTRGKATSAIRSVCAQSAFGLLCPEANADQLEAAVAEARKIADAFNATAALTRVTVHVMTGRIAPDDVEAVKAINSEVRELLDSMSDGLKRLDVKVVREAASRAREIGAMLSPDAEARVRIAIDTAREAAKKIVKAGEQGAAALDQAAVRKITEQRTAFLDLDDQKAVTAPAAVGARAVDLAPEGEEAPRRPRRGKMAAAGLDL